MAVVGIWVSLWACVRIVLGFLRTQITATIATTRRYVTVADAASFLLFRSVRQVALSSLLLKCSENHLEFCNHHRMQ